MALLWHKNRVKLKCSRNSLNKLPLTRLLMDEPKCSVPPVKHTAKGVLGDFRQPAPL